jgi:hypothetical protein
MLQSKVGLMFLRGRAARIARRARNWSIWDPEEVGLRLGWAHVAALLPVLALALALGSC